MFASVTVHLSEPPRPPEESTDVAIADLDLLFVAVTARLRSLAEPRSGNAGTEAGRIRAGVLECVQALEQLHATAMHEVARLHGLEVGGPQAEPIPEDCLYRDGQAHRA
jgi:hypothetical protein